MAETASAPTISDRSIAAWEIVSVTSSILIAEWLAGALFGTKFVLAIPVILAFALMIVSHRLRGETLRDVGFRLDNLGGAVLVVAMPTIVAVILILFAGWILGSLRLDLIISRPRYLLLPIWALAQQYVMQGFINRRAQIVCVKGWQSILIVSVLFGLLHLPNTNLVLFTFFGGALWAAIYQRTPNLFALALSQSILAGLLALSLPVSWLTGLRVGFKYFG